MTEELVWSESFLIGIDEIDQQHKDIIVAVNALHDAIKNKKSKDEIIALIEKLDFYIDFHFSTEEKSMKLYDYEKLDEHKKAHIFFKDTYNQIRSSYFYVDEQNFPRKKVLNLYSLLLAETFKSWLIFHLQTYDKDFRIFMQDKLNKKDE